MLKGVKLIVSNMNKLISITVPRGTPYVNLYLNGLTEINVVVHCTGPPEPGDAVINVAPLDGARVVEHGVEDIQPPVVEHVIVEVKPDVEPVAVKQPTENKKAPRATFDVKPSDCILNGQFVRNRGESGKSKEATVLMARFDTGKFTTADGQTFTSLSGIANAYRGKIGRKPVGSNGWNDMEVENADGCWKSLAEVRAAFIGERMITTQRV